MGMDWVGKEVFRGKVQGDKSFKSRYELGVRSGSMGMMVNSLVLVLVLVVALLAIGPLTRVMGKP